MDKIINYFIILFGDMIMCSSLSLFWNNILEKNNEIKNNAVKVIIIAVSTNIISSFLGQPLRLILTYSILIIINYFLYSKKIKASILSVAISESVIWLAEFSFIIIFSNIYSESVYTFGTNPILYVVISIYIAVILLIISKTKIPNIIYNSLDISPNKISNNEPIFYSLMVIFIVIISTIESHMNLSLTVIITTNTLMALIFIFIILKFTNVKNKYDNINKKYQTSISSLKEYETMIDKFRVNTHENKNELLTIRNMIKNNDKKIVEYIDALVDNKIKDNEKIMYQTSKIPEGGLRATIYSKLCVMDKYKIKYKLDISKNIRTVDLINLDEELILNICKILGVFLDNAIEEVRNLKNKEVNIELYVIDDEIYIDITNHFKGNIELTKFGKDRQSTKGAEHGYGLLLVNKIINDNKKHLKNERKIIGNQFTQTLIIKL